MMEYTYYNCMMPPTMKTLLPGLLFIVILRLHCTRSESSKSESKGRMSYYTSSLHGINEIRHKMVNNTT